MSRGQRGRGLPGFRFAGLAAGLKRRGARDLGLIEAAEGTSAAGFFTTSRAAAAPVLLCRRRLKKGRARAIVVNSGNANACTGERGEADARTMGREVARRLGVREGEVLVASTGVIGAPLPMAVLDAAWDPLVAGLAAGGAKAFAEAILTTDTRIKRAEAALPGGARVLGFAKGSGMIMPELATMLAFVCTDAPVEPQLLRELGREAVEDSFNAITVDGEPSTNDSVFLLASGQARRRPSRSALAGALAEVMGSLARQIVEDGEGAHHLVAVEVEGAASDRAADAIARRIANSPLVKTALHGQDPNWGRIVSAAATAGVRVDPARFDLLVGETAILRAGEWQGKAAEKRASRTMRKKRYGIRLVVGEGPGRRTLWTCDFSADYVRINADYRS
ncbi:MAG: bifunctional glutamate N-acetyltransferase/amino-acid acetyltransferase ArgJ [Deltaproteobacteria bacterium]|nr:bifunctional glutamate N-acetyltransferase/amino-acid acetyltransferase ArgJ [Deltaproteobacteria bacterium]